jgi:phosphatidylinositol alpha 1,6-mannosyltransferase
MRVAIYAGTYKKNQDGATKTLYELTDSLLRRNIKVGIWAFSITPQNRPGLSLHKIPSIPLCFYPDYQIALPIRQLASQLDEFQPHLIHIAAPDLVGVFLVKYAKRENIPVVMSYHTDFPSYLKPYKIDYLEKAVWKYFKWFYNQAHAVFVPTEKVARELAEKGIRHSKIWSRGIHPQVFNPTFSSARLRGQWGARGKKVILFSGRFVWYKDLTTVIEIYQLFKKGGGEEVVFVLLGKGPVEDELKRWMPEAVFPGYLSGKDLSAAYASADILLFPSTTEAFGNVVQEALSSGIPAIVSDQGGCQEIVENSGGGLIVRAKDSESFYRCCQKLLSDTTLYRKLRQNGLKYARDRVWEKINDAVISEYRRIYNAHLALSPPPVTAKYALIRKGLKAIRKWAIPLMGLTLILTLDKKNHLKTKLSTG